MRLRRPGLIERSLKFHGPDHQPRHVAAVGVLAADADFADAREIVDIVLLDIRAWEITDGPFEHKARELLAGHGLWHPGRSERAAAIPSQPQMHTKFR